MSVAPPSPPSALELGVTKEFDSLINSLASTAPAAVPSVETTKAAILKLLAPKGKFLLKMET